MDEFKEGLEQPVSKKKSKPKIDATRASGIGGYGMILFRGNEKYKFRLVPSDLWNGAEKQEFSEKEFIEFDKPAFYNGQ